MVVLPTYMYAYHMHGWFLRRSEEVSGPLEMELQMFGGHHVRLGSSVSAPVLETAELSLQPPLSVFDLRFLLCGISKDVLVVSICMEYPFQHFTFSLCVFTRRMNEYLIVYSRIALLFLNLKFIQSLYPSSPVPHLSLVILHVLTSPVAWVRVTFEDLSFLYSRLFLVSINLFLHFLSIFCLLK